MTEDEYRRREQLIADYVDGRIYAADWQKRWPYLTAQFVYQRLEEVLLADFNEMERLPFDDPRDWMNALCREAVKDLGWDK